MAVLFWLCVATVFYAYAGYALFLVLLARLRRKPIAKGEYHPRVSVVIAAHNEENNLERKLAGLYAQIYPRELLQIVVASDGSTDRTNQILAEHASHVTAVLLPIAGGKASALNHAVAASTGDLLIFMDARQTVPPNVVAELTSCFADPEIGAASGELHLETPDGQPSPDALGIYWKIEKLVRKLESATGSVVGATGALYAVRRNFYVPLPAGTLLDDVLVPMQVARAGGRVIFHEAAIARDTIFQERGREFGRKVRTLTGNYQLLQLAPWLLGLTNPLLFRLISHKLLRLAVPFLLAVMLFSSVLAHGAIYKLAFALQLALYATAIFGALLPTTRRWRIVSIAFTFVMLNAAAAVAFYNFLTGRARWA